MSQLYRPPVLFALCSGSASARGAPTSSLERKQKEFRDLHILYFQPEPRAMGAILCHAAEELGTKKKKRSCSTGSKASQLRHDDTQYPQRESEPVSPRTGSGSWVRFWGPKTLFMEEAQNANRSRTIHTPNLGGKQPSRCICKYMLLFNASPEISLATPRFAATDLQIQNPTLVRSLTQRLLQPVSSLIFLPQPY